MWPFRRKRRARLSEGDAERAAREAIEVDLVAVVSSPNTLLTPVTKTAAAFAQLQILERLVMDEPPQGLHRRPPRALEDTFTLLGTTSYGEAIALRTDDGAVIALACPEAYFGFGATSGQATPLTERVAEAECWTHRATGKGVVCFRENIIRTGDRVRLVAAVVTEPAVASEGYRSAPSTRFRATHARVEEVLDVPAW